MLPGPVFRISLLILLSALWPSWMSRSVCAGDVLHPDVGKWINLRPHSSTRIIISSRLSWHRALIAIYISLVVSPCLIMKLGSSAVCLEQSFDVVGISPNLDWGLFVWAESTGTRSDALFCAPNPDLQLAFDAHSLFIESWTGWGGVGAVRLAVPRLCHGYLRQYWHI